MSLNKEYTFSNPISASKFINPIEEKINAIQERLCGGEADQLHYFRLVGYISGLKEALALFIQIKREDD